MASSSLNAFMGEDITTTWGPAVAYPIQYSEDPVRSVCVKCEQAMADYTFEYDRLGDVDVFCADCARESIVRASYTHDIDDAD